MTPNRRILWGLLVALVLGLCGLVVFVVLTQVSTASIASNLEKIKASGAPTNLTELREAMSARQAEGDAAASNHSFEAALAAAKEICKRLQDSYAPSVLTNDRYNEQGLGRAREAFAAHPDLVAAVEEWVAGPLPATTPPSDASPEQFLQSVVSLTQSRITVARALHFRGLMALEDEDWGEMARVIQALLGFARRCEATPGAIAMQNALFVEGQGLELLHLLLREGAYSEANPIVEALAQSPPLTDRLTDMIREERAFGLALTERYPDKDSYWKRYAYNRFRLNYLKYFERLESGLKTGLYGDVTNVRIENYVSPDADAAKMTAPSLRSAIAEAYRVEALRRLLLIANRILEHSHATGAVPQNLRDADVPAAWKRDPFDGQELRLAQTTKGWIVYSVGENLHNDGGETGGISDDIAVGPFPLPSDTERALPAAPPTTEDPKTGKPG
ncbi:MAG: hypothetical protein ACUVQQ_08085 [Thermogutta sp.]